jgi:integrase
MRRKGKLNDKRIAQCKDAGRYGDGHGLWLQIRPGAQPGTLRRSWLLRYELNGKERWLGLGPLHTVDLKEARERARKARLQLLDGIDPLQARAEQKAAQALAAAKAITFEAAARQYFSEHAGKWRNTKHAKQFLSTLQTYAFPIIGKLPVAAIDTGLVLRVLKPIWPAKTETANRVRGRIESVLDWATVHSYRSGDNPARWKGHLAEALPARGKIQQVEHHAALPFADIPTFMSLLAQREGVAARALEFTILTAARTGEVIGAIWDEIDLKAKTWTVSAGRMKGSREHRVPLSDRALEILRSAPRMDANPFVFLGAGQRGISNMAMAAVLKRMGRADLTVHGMRSTFRDWAAERTSFPNFVVEMALAHVVGNKVEGAYRRGDLFEKRRRLMNEWTRYCSRPATRGEVVPLKFSTN